MSFVIHLHLGNANESPEPSEPARAAHPGAVGAHRPRSPGWWTHRWSSRRDYDEHLRRTFGALAGGVGRSAADEHPADDVIPLADEDLCESLDDAAS